MTATLPYEDFIHAKVRLASSSGMEINPGDVNPWLKPHAAALVRWACRGRCRAIFARFGLHKTSIQLEIARLIQKHAGGRFLICAPLGVRQEFFRDAEILGTPLRFIRSIDECDSTGIYLTNYEPVRDGKLDPQPASPETLSVMSAAAPSRSDRETSPMRHGQLHGVTTPSSRGAMSRHGRGTRWNRCGAAQDQGSAAGGVG